MLNGHHCPFRCGVGSWGARVRALTKLGFSRLWWQSPHWPGIQPGPEGLGQYFCAAFTFSPVCTLWLEAGGNGLWARGVQAGGVGATPLSWSHNLHTVHWEGSSCDGGLQPVVSFTLSRVSAGTHDLEWLSLLGRGRSKVWATSVSSKCTHTHW